MEKDSNKNIKNISYNSFNFNYRFSDEFKVYFSLAKMPTKVDLNYKKLNKNFFRKPNFKKD